MTGFVFGRVEKNDSVGIMEIDYSQMELRVLAQESGDMELIRCFNEGVDVHKRTASMITGKEMADVTDDERQMAKPVNFGVVFGQGPGGLVNYARDSYGVVMTEEEAERYLKAYYRLYPGVRRYQKRVINQAKKDGCVWVKWDGEMYHRRNLLNITSSNPRKRSGDERRALNTPIQGGASLFTLITITILHRLHRKKLVPGLKHIIGTVHDSIWLEVDALLMKECLEFVGCIMVGLPCKVPIEVDGKFGPSLGELSKCGSVSSLRLKEGNRFDYRRWEKEKVFGLI